MMASLSPAVSSSSFLGFARRLAARRSLHCVCVALATIICLQVLAGRAYPQVYAPASLAASGLLLLPHHLPTGPVTRPAASTAATAAEAQPTMASNSSSTPPARAAAACPEQPPDLLGDKFSVEADPSRAPSWLQLEAALPDVRHGGWRPASCTARQRVALVVPYRQRDVHLRLLLAALHPMLRRQQADYRVFVVEQGGQQPFNRATLFNVGFVEVNKAFPGVDCFIFHDVDLLPEHDHNMYRCGNHPRHMSVAVDKFNYRLPYATLFGGVCALTPGQFKAANGYSNAFYGWGGEDDDFSQRMAWLGYKIARYPDSVARYKMIKHGKEAKNLPNPRRFSLINKGRTRWKVDGLSSLDYTVVGVQDRQVAHVITVEIPDEARVLRKFNLA